MAASEFDLVVFWEPFESPRGEPGWSVSTVATGARGRRLASIWPLLDVRRRGDELDRDLSDCELEEAARATLKLHLGYATEPASIRVVRPEAIMSPSDESAESWILGMSDKEKADIREAGSAESFRPAVRMVEMKADVSDVLRAIERHLNAEEPAH